MLKVRKRTANKTEDITVPLCKTRRA